MTPAANPAASASPSAPASRSPSPPSTPTVTASSSPPASPSNAAGASQTPQPDAYLKQHVISTEAADGFIGRRAVERPLYWFSARGARNLPDLRKSRSQKQRPGIPAV